MTSELRRQIEADDGSLPERWNAEDVPDSVLVGTLVRYETIVTDYGESQIAVIEDEDDGHLWGVALFRSVLKKKFDTLEPRPGDMIALKYVGLAEPRTKGANPYHNYAVRVMHNSAPASSAPMTGVDKPEEDDEIPF